MKTKHLLLIAVPFAVALVCAFLAGRFSINPAQNCSYDIRTHTIIGGL